MKRKLIVLLALCFAFNTVAFAENAEVETVIEEAVEDVTESVVEPEFVLVVENVTEEAEEEATWVEVEAEVETITEEVTEEVTEAEEETEAETVTETEPVTEAEEALESIPIEKVSEAATEAASEVEETETEAEEVPSEEETAANDEVEEVTENEVEILSAEVHEIVIADEITDNSKRVLIEIEGNNLEGRCASVKVSPINGYNEFCYIRSVVLENATENSVEVMLSESVSGIYRVDVNVENLMRESKVIVIGESSDERLKCEADRKNLVITGQSATAGIKAVMVKIMNTSGGVVFLRQVYTAEDGGFAVNAVLPEESESYVVLVSIEGESGGLVKKIAPISPTDAKHSYTYTLNGSAGERANVIVYGKNVTDKSKYLYEIDYSECMNDIQIADLCAFTRERETTIGYTENNKVEIISVSDGKILFAVEKGPDTDGTTMWSGIINIVRFERKTSNTVTVTLRVYE